MDFLGINYYSRSVVSAGEPWNVHQSGLEVTDMDWEVYPQGLTALLLRLHARHCLRLIQGCQALSPAYMALGLGASPVPASGISWLN